MSNQEFNSLDDFERFIRSTITSWSPRQRIALAASMAQRWLPVYEEFSEEEEWGDPASFEQAVQSVWKCVLGGELTKKDRKLHEKAVSENTPHPDDFCSDTDRVIATSAMIGWAMNACGKDDNIDEAVMALVCGFEAFAPNIYQNTHWNEIEGQLQKIFELTDEKMNSIRGRMESLEDLEETTLDDWRSPQVQNELAKQIKLLKLIGDMVQIDKQHINALRETLLSPELVGTPAPTPEPVRGLTNEAIFEQYRRRMEPDLKRQWDWEDRIHDLQNTGAVISVYLGEWFGRYLRRKDAIEQGPMIDVVAHDALLAKYSTHDAAFQDDPGWDEETRFWIETVYQNPLIGFDVDSPEKPHRYGPSLRRLWIEAKQRGDSDLWNSVLQWARHQSPAWTEAEQRKKNRLAYAPELSERLTRELSWDATGVVDHPWATKVGEETWRIRLNDFPDDIMYTLIIDDAIIGNFHDWPEAWQR